MTRTNRLFASAVVIAVAVVLPLTAGATQPTSVQLPVNDVEVFTGADSPCPFDVTFTGTGTVTMTTFYDKVGTPVRQSVHGALTHTISSAFHILASNGPAPVHIDLATGQMVITGKEVAFHVPGDGIVLGQAGRLVLAADNSQLSFNGNAVTDVEALCAALGA